VLIHGTATESSRIVVTEVLQPLGIQARETSGPIAPGEAAYAHAVLHPGLKRLLDVRRSSACAIPRTAWSS
jgi:hypothetical protein